MKINLPILKDEDTKDAITYQSWRWDLTVYHCVGCRNCTLLPYAIWSLQGYPGELVQHLGMDISLNDVLTILDGHYNNVKALDALNNELFQLQMADKETIGLGHSSIETSPSSGHFVSRTLPSQLSGNMTTSMVGYPNILKPWWPTLRPACSKRLIPITCRLQGKQRRKTPWSYPKAHEAKQPITLSNPG